MTIEANKYIYISTNASGFSDNRLIEALLGYVPVNAQHRNISPYEINNSGILWSRTKLSEEYWFYELEARARLRELDRKLDFRKTVKGDIIIYRDVHDEVLRILDAYHEYSKRDESKLFNPEDHIVSLRDAGTPITLNCQPILTMPRNLGRSAAMSMLNSLYGLNPTGGLLNWNDWFYEFKLYFGVERATGKQKTVCLWKDGEKTVIRGDKSVLSMPVQYAVAWCYVKRKFKTTSQFKKYVDDHSHIMDGITYFEGDARVKGAQASVNNRTKKYDIYDAAALAITAKHYGSVKTIMAYCDGWGE